MCCLASVRQDSSGMAFVDLVLCFAACLMLPLSTNALAQDHVVEKKKNNLSEQQDFHATHGAVSIIYLKEYNMIEFAPIGGRRGNLLGTPVVNSDVVQIAKKIPEVERVVFLDVFIKNAETLSEFSAFHRLESAMFVRTNLTDEMLESFVKNVPLTGISITNSSISDQSVLVLGKKTGLKEIVLEGNCFLSDLFAKKKLAELLPAAKIEVGRGLW